MLDVLIKDGLVVDGTGAGAFRADVGVRAGRVVVVGATEEGARRTVDAAGLVVAPGFVDLHTHYDAQLFWDPTASPSPLHGVTTVFGGNCGFTLAPLATDDDGYLMRMMARVEGMPLAALEQGLGWDWSSFGSWLGALDGKVGVNAGFLAGHSALRRATMGEAFREPATPDQITAMRTLLHESLAAGALGFSSSTAPPHHDGEGQPVPSRYATNEELLALAGVVAEHPGTTLELILAGCLNGFTPAEVELMTAMSVAADRPLNWNVLGVDPANPDKHLSQLAASDHAAERGGRIVALTLPHSSGIRLSFLAGTVLDGLPGWQPVLSLPVPERIRALADPAVRQRLADGASSPEAGVLGGLANWPQMQLAETFAPENLSLAGRTVGDIAHERGQDAFDVLLDVVIADGLRTGLKPGGARRAVPSDADWKAKAAIWTDERTVIGGSDAGAHLDMMCGAVYSTALLAAVRDHQVLTLEEAVRQLSDVPARLYGLRDRGRIAEGAWADLVCFDPDTVGFGPEHTRDDLPGGASRLYAESEGIEHVLVNGTAVVESGRLTGALAGTVLRSGTDTDTVRASA